MYFVCFFLQLIWIPCSWIFSPFVLRKFVFLFMYLNFPVLLAPMFLFTSLLNNVLVLMCSTPTYCLHSNLWEILFSFSPFLITYSSAHMFVLHSLPQPTLFSSYNTTCSPQSFCWCSPLHLLTGQNLATGDFSTTAHRYRIPWVLKCLKTVFLKDILAKYKFLGSAN